MIMYKRDNILTREKCMATEEDLRNELNELNINNYSSKLDYLIHGINLLNKAMADASSITSAKQFYIETSNDSQLISDIREIALQFDTLVENLKNNLKGFISSLSEREIQLFINNGRLVEYKNFIIRCHSKQSDSKILINNIINNFQNSIEFPKKNYELISNKVMELSESYVVNGTKVKVDRSNVNSLTSSTCREVRKFSTELVGREYEKYGDLFASNLAEYVRNKNNVAKLKGYKNFFYMKLSEDGIEAATYNNLLKSINKHLPTLHKYYETKKVFAGLKELKLYDLNIPLTAIKHSEYSFEKAKTIIINAIKPLGSEYQKIVKRAFLEGWVKVREHGNSRNISYEINDYNGHPYIYLNWNDSLNDVVTLGHEIGHLVHNYIVSQVQKSINATIDIVSAEIASFTFQNLVIYQLLLESNSENKYEIMNLLCNTVVTATFTQGRFSEFEKILYFYDADNKTLSKQSLNKISKELIEKYQGKAVSEFKYQTAGWARIPHFYFDFYVYKYILSFAISGNISFKIIKGDQATLKGFQKFLSLGSNITFKEKCTLLKIQLEVQDLLSDIVKWIDKILKMLEIKAPNYQ